MMRRNLAVATIAVLVLILVGAVLYYNLGRGHRAVETASQAPIVGKAQAGQPAPNFVVATTNGLFDLSKTNKPVLLEVFATWCPHCQRETAVIDRLYRKYRNRVDFVAVSGSQTAMDGTSESSQLDVLEWSRRFHAEYPVAYDPLLNVANLYLQGGYPTIAVIGRDKKVAYLNSGELSYQELAAALDKALR
ncbi:MAG TPA: TlpA family protein disulfide reductase [Candidatus Cybelea sp.]|jgi:thiol-disulfide isomerase/thioredoxin|nr:TlpA family protein disulfide reductase [Candidatus Cybelea sp.]